jgi:polyphosphate kinase
MNLPTLLFLAYRIQGLKKVCDVLLHFPYQHYQHVLDFLEEAAVDKDVTSIKISLYRVASDSKVCKALIKAAQNGKDVLVFNEVKARFDEESNIYWGEELQKAGAKVVYSFDRLKVHSKICLITRNENGKPEDYGYFGTGNFNEKTSTIYCDHSLLTKDKSLTADLAQVFKYLIDESYKPKFDALLVAPFNMRERFVNLLNNEIIQAELGNKAQVTLKMNSLEDDDMIQGLYRASQAGVKITIIVRGICCLIPGVKGVSENCKVISIVDRYLEHGRMFHFHNQGNDLLYLASADWMKRNLSRRVEVGFPIKDVKLKAELLKMLDLQLNDNTKARVLNKTQSNPYRKYKSKKKVRAQFDTYRYLKKLGSS